MHVCSFRVWLRSCNLLLDDVSHVSIACLLKERGAITEGKCRLLACLP